MARVETDKAKGDCGRKARAVPALRPSKNGRWRALALIGVHVLVALHVAHWLRAGETLSPLEPSEAMEFTKHDLVNAGQGRHVCHEAATRNCTLHGARA